MSQFSNAKIISDGTTHGTFVLVNGAKLRGVKSLTIHPMSEPGEVVRATIEIIGPDLEIQLITLPAETSGQADKD